jgi:CRP-like cAMP-binding protein
MADEAQSVRIAREVVLSTFAGESKGLTWEFQRISAAMQDLHLEEGEVLFAEGAPAVYQYFIVDGEIALSSPGKPTLTFPAHSVVGAMDALFDRPLSYTAVVTRKAHLLRIRVDDWLDVLEDSPELARIFITNLAAAVHQMRLRPPPLGGFGDLAPASAVSDSPRTLHLVDRIVLLRGAPTFASATVQTLTSLAELATVVHAEEDEVLAPRGEPKRAMLLVASGEVAATREAPTLAGRFGPGALVCGALAVTDLTDYEFRARSRTRVLAIARDDYVDLMEEHFGLVRSTARALIEERVRLTLRGAGTDSTSALGSRP